MTVTLVVSHNFVCPVTDDADPNTVSPSHWNDTHGITGVDQINTELAGKQALDATLTALAAYNTNGLLTQTAADTFAGRTLTGTTNQISISNGNGVGGNPTVALDPTDIIVPAILTVPNTGLHLLDTNASHDLIVKPGSDLTADRTFTLTTGDVNRTLTLGGDTTLNGGTHSGTNTGDQTLGGLGGQPLDATLTALAAFNTNGILVQTAADTFAGRQLTAPAAGFTISNNTGVAGNPTFALANDLSALEGLGSTGIAVRTAADTWAQRTITGTGNQISVSNGDGVSGNPVLSLPSDIIVSNFVNSSLGKLLGLTNTAGATASTNYLSIVNQASGSANPEIKVDPASVDANVNLILSAKGTGAVKTGTGMSFFVQGTQSSTSYSSGALVVSGGIGSAGAINCNDTIKSTNRTNGGIGYATGTGGAVTQLTSKNTGVTLNAMCGRITTHNSSIAANSADGFQFSNTSLLQGDILVLNTNDTGSLGNYCLSSTVWGNGTAHIYIRNLTSGALAEALIINFAIIRIASS